MSMCILYLMTLQPTLDISCFVQKAFSSDRIISRCKCCPTTLSDAKQIPLERKSLK